MKAGISVIIPTYNRVKYIKEAIQSALDQEYDGKLEIIISDDGSTDDTLSAAHSFGDKVKILGKPDDCKTQGVASTRNRGIKASTQPFLCFLDSDDFYLPGHFKKIISEFEKEPKLSFAFCRVLEVKEENESKLFKPWSREEILKNDVKNPVVSRSRIVHTNSFIFRREIFATVGLFNEKYTNGEDGDLWMRISEQFNGKLADHFGAVYRRHDATNQLSKNPKNKINQCALLIFEDAKDRYFDLKLHDQRRIFKIKHNLIWLKYRSIKSAKFNYYFRYATLLIQYPTGFFQKLIEDYYVRAEEKKRKGWDKLEKFMEKN